MLEKKPRVPCPPENKGNAIGFTRFLIAFGVIALLSCSPSVNKEKPPNVLFVLWDTVRADRMSLYGYDKPTTPFLESWTKTARVFENCTSTANSTVPSHGAIFTGLFPREHGANHRYKHLDERHETIAERFKESGYRTYLYSANPHISAEENFHQGFDVEEHPWDQKYGRLALKILNQKIDPRDESSELPEKFKDKRVVSWDVKASGKIAEFGLLSWLTQNEGDRDRPFFAFLNYMEAHRPFVPPEKYRSRLMSPDQVAQSYKVDRSWLPMWSYTFGLGEYKPEELEIMALTYDACIAELDDLFKELIGALEEKGHLENTIVVLTSDHGEHLGEHHMLDHQFSVYEGLIRVPLIFHYPRKITPGRVALPVINFDTFPTLLAMAGVDPPAGLSSHAVSLLSPEEKRLRMAEFSNDFDGPIENIKKEYPEWEPSSYLRTLRALYDEDLKYIWSSDKRDELYDLSTDPDEKTNLTATRGDDVKRMREKLKKIVRSMSLYDYDNAQIPNLSPEQRARLKAIGYIFDEEEEDSRK